jgi:hypothetical protein
MFQTSARRLWPVFAALLLLSCQKDPPTAGGSVEENEILAGTIVLADGTPVAGARVRLYAVNFEPAPTGAPKAGLAKTARTDSVAVSVQTDENGRYRIDSIARGEYNILGGSADGKVCYRDSVFLGAGSPVKVTDTLRASGTLAGVVGLQPNHDPRSVTVEILWTYVFADVGSDGKFLLTGLADGRYTARIWTTEANYKPLLTTLRIRTGMADVLPDTLRLLYLGIPVVTGLKVEYDTLAGAAKVSWNKADYGDFNAYVVFRNTKNYQVPETVPLGATQDTFWIDTLYKGAARDSGLESNALPAAEQYEYSVRIRNRALDEGKFFGSASLAAVPPSWAETYIGFRFVNADDLDTSLRDSVKVIVLFRNRTRSVQNITWRREGLNAPLRETAFTDGRKSGEDTLTLSGFDLGGNPIYCQALDDGGRLARKDVSNEWIPVVTGIQVRLDTLAGTARISWNNRAYYDFHAYEVFRTQIKDYLPAQTLSMGETRDTLLVDPLFEAGDYGLANGEFPPAKRYEYSVRIRDNSAQAGPANGSVTVNAVPPSWVQTHMDIQAQGMDNLEASLYDTVRVIASFRNKSRDLEKIVWRRDGSDEPLKESTFADGLRSGEDTLAFVGSSLGEQGIYFQLSDDAGTIWRQDIQVNFIASPPVALPSPDTTVWRGGKVSLRGEGTTRFGRIVKREWDIGQTGTFSPSQDGTVEFTAPDSYGSVSCAFRVTNEDGEMDTAFTQVTVAQVWEKVRADLPFEGSWGRAVIWKDKAWVIGGNQSFVPGSSVYSSEDGEHWQAEKNVPKVTDRKDLGALVYHDKLFIIGGSDQDRMLPYRDVWSTEDGNFWTHLADGEGLIDTQSGGQSSLIEFDGKMLCYPNHDLASSYDGSYWWPDSSDIKFTYRESFVVFDGQIVSFGHEGGVFYTSNDAKKWTKNLLDYHLMRDSPSLSVFENKLWLIGGDFLISGYYATQLDKSVSYAEGNLGNWHSGPSFSEPVGPGNISFVLQNTLWVVYDGTLWRLR